MTLEQEKQHKEAIERFERLKADIKALLAELKQNKGPWQGEGK